MRSFDDLTRMDRRRFLAGLLGSAVALGALPALGIAGDDRIDLSGVDLTLWTEEDFFTYGQIVEVYNSTQSDGVYRVIRDEAGGHSLEP